jgi:hypothetical protein
MPSQVTKRLRVWEEAKGRLRKVCLDESAAILESSSSIRLELPQEILECLSCMEGEEVAILRRDGKSEPEYLLRASNGAEAHQSRTTRPEVIT